MAVRAEAEEVIGRKGERGCFIIPTQQAFLVAEVCRALPFPCHVVDGMRSELIDSTMHQSELEMPMW